MTFTSAWFLVAGFWRLFSMKDKPFEEKDAKEDAKESDQAYITDDSLQQNPMVHPFGVLPMSMFGFPPSQSQFFQPTVSKSATVLPPQPPAPSYIYVPGLPQTTTRPHVQSIQTFGLEHSERSQEPLGQTDRTSQVPPPYHDGFHHQ
jgi:hypothetical protein